MFRQVCTYDEGYPGSSVRSDATQIRRHINSILLELLAYQAA
jgi:hypothetical protein